MVHGGESRHSKIVLEIKKVKEGMWISGGNRKYGQKVRAEGPMGGIPRYWVNAGPWGAACRVGRQAKWGAGECTPGKCWMPSAPLLE